MYKYYKRLHALSGKMYLIVTQEISQSNALYFPQ